jgi:hypothetical protein
MRFFICQLQPFFSFLPPLFLIFKLHTLPVDRGQIARTQGMDQKRVKNSDLHLTTYIDWKEKRNQENQDTVQ